MRSSLRAGLVFAGVLAVPVACSSGGDSGKDPQQREHACGTTAPLTYETFGGPFLLDWCTGCHSSSLPEGQRQEAPIDINFDRVEDVVRFQGLIKHRAVDMGDMPPAGGPSEAERQLLAEWLDCGAPVETREFAPPAPPPTKERPKPTGACAEPGDLLPPSVLPRCSNETWQCMEECAQTEGEDTIDDCQDACQDADTSAPITHEGLPLGCTDCVFEQLLGCGWTTGCADETAELNCCLLDCFSSPDPNGCFNDECMGTITAFGYCVSYGDGSCFDYDVGAMGQCFDKGGDAGSPAARIWPAPSPEPMSGEEASALVYRLVQQRAANLR